MIAAPATTVSSAERRPGAGDTFAGFLLSGFLLALLGALLPAWGYHRDPPEFTTVGNYFLCLAFGIVSSAWGARRLIAWRSLSFLFVFACSVACVSLAVLAAAGPTASSWWRAGGLFGLGLGAGLLNVGLFQAASQQFISDAGGLATHGNIWHGVGSLCASLFIAIAFFLFSDPNTAILLALTAAVPGVFALMYAKSSYAPAPAGKEPSWREMLADFRGPGDVLFALLLFFQFGNEWSIAGWLPIFLMRRVGMSLKAALLTLALYWVFLVAGRLGAIPLLPRVRHGRLLLGSVISALFGCLILYSTKTGFGAVSGAFFVGAGYACVHPLVSEAMRRRYPSYRPGLFNGIFSLGLLGGLLAPASLGYAAEAWGVGAVMGIPVLGACMVMVLVLSTWLVSKVTGR